MLTLEPYDPATPAVHGAPSDAALRARGIDPAAVLDFSASINPLGPPPGVRAAVAAAAIERYPDPESTALRCALAARHDIPEAMVLVGNGSSELLYLAARAFLAAGETVAVPAPSFHDYARAAAAAGAAVTLIRAGAATGYRWRVDLLAGRLADCAPRLLFLGRPSNPTGQMLDDADLARLLDAAPDALLVVDEAFLPLVAPAWRLPDLVRGGRVVLIRSLTKDYALAGLRLGYAVAAPPLIAALAAQQPPWSVNAAAQAAGLACLEDPGYLDETRRAVAALRDQVATGCARLGLATIVSPASYLLIEVGDARAAQAFLLERGLLVRDCASFGMPAHIRVGVRLAADNERLLGGLAAWQERAHR